MEPFVTHTGRAVPLRRTNVDTDQIIPAVYLKRVTRDGFGDGLFAAWREDPSFVLNQPRYEGATILVAGTDFGTGSSREHAVWALLDYGFRAVIAPRFGDIFRNNATKAGLLPVVLPEKVVTLIQDAAEAVPPAQVTVDLGAREVRVNGGGLAEDLVEPFQIDDYTRWRLMEGLDDIGLTLRHEDAISAFEATRPSFLPAALLSPGGRPPYPRCRGGAPDGKNRHRIGRAAPTEGAVTCATKCNADHRYIPLLLLATGRPASCSSGVPPASAVRPMAPGIHATWPDGRDGRALPRLIVCRAASRHRNFRHIGQGVKNCR
jgi:3-isopropylmalate/(R)-2-methylmalate dehydratase small subunit